MRKRSRFDVAPEHMLPTAPALPQSAMMPVATHLTMDSQPVHVNEHLAKALENIRSTISNSASSSVPQQVELGNPGTTNYVSVNAGAFQERLDKALQKNLDYIAKKDLLASRGLLLALETEASSAATVSSMSNALFDDKYSVERHGIGSQHIGSSSSTLSTQRPAPEPTSIYVSGLPKDFSVEEIGSTLLSCSVALFVRIGNGHPFSNMSTHFRHTHDPQTMLC